MPALSKKLLRTLPTLTEVVDVPAPVVLASGASGDLLEEVLIQRVLQRLELTLDAQVQKVVADALQEQMKDLAPRIRQRVDNAVRKAVGQALIAETQAPASRAG